MSTRPPILALFILLALPILGPGLPGAGGTGSGGDTWLGPWAGSLAGQTPEVGAETGTFAFQGVTVIPMDEARTLPDHTVLVRELAQREVWQVPTQYLWNHLFGYVDPDEILSQDEFRYIAPALRENYRERAIRNRENPQITPASHQAHAQMRQEFLRAAHQAGVPILMGTDSPQLFNVPGFALHREIPLMEDAGMSPFQVLVSGTREVTRYVG